MYFGRKIVDDDWDIKLKYENEDLVKDISNHSSIEGLSTKLNKSESETIVWLDKVISFIKDEKDIRGRWLQGRMAGFSF